MASGGTSQARPHHRHCSRNYHSYGYRCRSTGHNHNHRHRCYRSDRCLGSGHHSGGHRNRYYSDHCSDHCYTQYCSGCYYHRRRRSIGHCFRRCTACSAQPWCLFNPSGTRCSEQFDYTDRDVCTLFRTRLETRHYRPQVHLKFYGRPVHYPRLQSSQS